MAKAIIEIQAQALEVGDVYDTRCGIADLAFAVITSVRHVTFPGGGDRVEITYEGDAMCNSRRLVATSTVRIEVEVPDAPAAPASTPTAPIPAASEIARSIRQPLDHQPKQARRSSGKTGSTMSVARRRAVLANLVARVNAGTVTAASYLAGLALVGRHLVRCLSYSETDVEILRAAAVAYPKTSHLILIGA